MNPREWMLLMQAEWLGINDPPRLPTMEEMLRVKIPRTIRIPVARVEAIQTINDRPMVGIVEEVADDI